jgi:putative transposase
MVSESGVTPLPRHVAAVQDCPPPTDIKQLQRFLGLINFYRRFLPAIARTLQPLTDLLKGSPKTLLWSTAAESAFAAAKAALVAAVQTLPLSARRKLRARLRASSPSAPTFIGPTPGGVNVFGYRV